MYREYFGLKENPFSLAPDPQFFFLSEGHREAVAHLVYGVESDGGFILLTGEVGTGKTTTLRYLFELLPENAEIAFILNPRLKAEELLEEICKEFGIPLPEGDRSTHRFVSAIYDYLLDLTEKGRRAILVVEEAQNLSPQVLEQIRLLTNLETRQRKLLQIILIGQPELREMLEEPSLRQLSQRITARYHLGPLSESETFAYVRHRLTVAGGNQNLFFPKKTLKRLYRMTGGIPRLINLICDRALLGAFVQEKTQVDPKTLANAAGEIFGRKAATGVRVRLSVPRLLLLMALFLGLLSAPLIYLGKGVIPFDVFPKGPTVPRTSAGDKGHRLLVLEKPATFTTEETRIQAYRALAEYWGIPFHPSSGRNICQEVQEFGLQCLSGKGGLTDLRQWNKPTVLTLQDEQGVAFYATLLALGEKSATFALGKARGQVDTEELKTKWMGEYTLFWKPPPGFTGKGRANWPGDLAAWMDRHLAYLGYGKGREGKGPLPPEDREKALRAFQVSAGLVPDGIPGPRTLVALADAAGVGGPTLTPPSGRP